MKSKQRNIGKCMNCGHAMPLGDCKIICRNCGLDYG